MRLGRVVPGGAETERTTPARAVAAGLGRVEPPEVLAASAKAEAIVARAEADAARILAEAEARAQSLAHELEARAKTEAASAVAARELVLAAREDAEVERRLDQVTDLARLLAERLLGEALALDPSRVVALARQALTEARGARRYVLAAHPEDAPHLEHALASGSLAASASVTVDPTRRRGSLRLETDVGTLDAELAPALDRLTAKLREAMRRG